MPDLEYAFKATGQLVVEVGTALGYHVDRYVQKVLGDRYTSRLEDVIRDTRTTKVQLNPTQLSLLFLTSSGASPPLFSHPH